MLPFGILHQHVFLKVPKIEYSPIKMKGCGESLVRMTIKSIKFILNQKDLLLFFISFCISLGNL